MIFMAAIWQFLADMMWGNSRLRPGSPEQRGVLRISKGTPSGQVGQQIETET